MSTKRLIPKALFLIVLAALFAACGASTSPTAPSSGGASVQAAKGAAAAKSPLQRVDMYQAAPSMTIDVNKTYRATIETNKGNIVLDLYPKDAPQHVNNFVFLARDGFYDGLTFHRVVPGFVIQGGDPKGDGTGGPGYGIPPEIKRPHPKGALAMARTSGPAETTPSSGSQFYITLDATPFLDGQYTSFGQATPDSMSVVEKIAVGDVIKTITIQEQ